MDHERHKEEWDVVIGPTQPWWRLDLGEVWNFRDLLVLLVRRDLLAVYKQTILGPLWQVLQPLLTALVLAVIFGMMARIAPTGHPPVLFYLAGVIPWTFFANVIQRTSQTLVWNAALMSKVYFPRMVAPIATTLSTLVGFLLQLATFFLIALLYRLVGGYGWGLGTNALLLPVLTGVMAVLAFGLGILVASLTVRFRDLGFLLGFGIQLLMFASPVIFPLSIVPQGSIQRQVIELNPMTGLIEGFRAVLIGTPMDWGLLPYSAGFALVTLLVGAAVFQRAQRSFADLV